MLTRHDLKILDDVYSVVAEHLFHYLDDEDYPVGLSFDERGEMAHRAGNAAKEYYQTILEE